MNNELLDDDGMSLWRIQGHESEANAWTMIRLHYRPAARFPNWHACAPFTITPTVAALPRRQALEPRRCRASADIGLNSTDIHIPICRHGFLKGLGCKVILRTGPTMDARVKRFRKIVRYVWIDALCGIHKGMQSLCAYEIHHLYM